MSVYQKPDLRLNISVGVYSIVYLAHYQKENELISGVTLSRDRAVLDVFAEGTKRIVEMRQIQMEPKKGGHQ